jgi:hypothetical protein
VTRRGGLDTDLDPVPLSFAHAAEHGHHQAVSLDAAPTRRPSALGGASQDAQASPASSRDDLGPRYRRTMRLISHCWM